MKNHEDGIQEWLETWRNDPAIGHRKMYAHAMGRLLKKLPVPLEQVTPEILEACAKKASDSWDFREKVLIGIRHFVDYCHDKGWIKTKPQLRRNGLGTFRDTPLPESLSKEIEGVFAKHRNRKTGDPLKHVVLKKITQDFEAFYSIVAKVDSKRNLVALEDFTARDLDTYQQAMEGRGSLYNGQPMSPRTVKTHASHILSVFGAAKKILGWKINPMDDYELPQYEHVQRDVYLTKDEVAAPSTPGALEGRTLREQFLAVRNMAMAAVQYDPALRPEEVVKLLDHELLWNRSTKGGLLPFIIRGAKARPDGHEEVFSLTPPAVAAIRCYLEIRARYCAKEKVVVQLVKDPKTRKDLGSPLFITEDGRAMAVATYEGLFQGLVRKAGLDSSRISSYAMRHSRISHWLEDGVPIDRVSRLARHRDVNFTMKHYAHYRPDSDQHILEKIYGTKPQIEPILTKDILPERPVLRQILKAAAKLLGITMDAGKVDQLEEALAEKVQGRQGREELCYSIVEALEKLDLGRTQIYDWMRKGYLHPVELSNGRKGLPKDEIDHLATLRSSKEASIILGYREKVPTTVQRNVREATLKATQLGNEYLFSDRDLADHLLWKNGHKRALGVRPHRPRSTQPTKVASTGAPVFH
jgi:site-specific recombinase XerD